jgi:hypothetical protein
VSSHFIPPSPLGRSTGFQDVWQDEIYMAELLVHYPTALEFQISVRIIGYYLNIGYDHFLPLLSLLCMNHPSS